MILHRYLRLAFILIFISSFINASDFIEEKITNDLSLYEKNKIILDRCPEYFWNENKTIFLWGILGDENPIMLKGGFNTKGSAGLIPYINHKKEIYILLSSETWGIDKNKYCDLGGAVEAYENADGNIQIDTFLDTLLRESYEESGGLYQFSMNEVLNRGHIISYIHELDGFFKYYESIIAFQPVECIYFTHHFIDASKFHAENLSALNLCPWGFQEKGDYQWLALEELYRLLQSKESNRGVFRNIHGQMVEIELRDHLVDALSSDKGLEVLSAILSEASALTLEEETCL